MAVAELIRGPVHADIGTDHGLLPLYLLKAGLCRQVVAVDISPSTLELPRERLRNHNAEVRLGDGFECLREGEVDSVSLCGMGGLRLAKILSRFPRRVPAQVVAQPNRDAHLVREWAWRSGYHLVSEQIVVGRWVYPILEFHKGEGQDPAYADVEKDLGFHFGPLLLKSQDETLRADLERRWCRFQNYPPTVEKNRLERALAFVGAGPHQQLESDAHHA